MKLKCIIVDDEPIARKLCKNSLRRSIGIGGQVDNPLKAVSLLDGNVVDIIF